MLFDKSPLECSLVDDIDLVFGPLLIAFLLVNVILHAILKDSASNKQSSVQLYQTRRALYDNYIILSYSTIFVLLFYSSYLFKGYNMNKLLLYSLFLSYITQAKEFIKIEGVLDSHKLDFIQMFKNNEKLKDSEFFTVHDCDVNHVLHAMNHDVIKDFENLDQLSQKNEPHLISKTHGKGGNLRGAAASFWISKFAVHALAQTAYVMVAGATSLVYPPAAPVVYCSLQLTFATFVEIISNMVADRSTAKLW